MPLLILNSKKKSSGAAVGGTEVLEVDGYRIHAFKSSGIFEVSSALEVEYLIVAGGGKGGKGGGGAGGLLSGTTILSPNTYSILVGGAESNFELGENVAIAGGNGGYNSNGFNGGSGGGGGVDMAKYNGGLGIEGQGNNGGRSCFHALLVKNSSGGGGGGAGSGGGNCSGGGNGLYFGNLFGDSFGDVGYFSGGGGSGRANTSTNSGGLGGGGNGASKWGTGENGLINTGGGGGGIYGNGGSGIVIIRYAI